MMKGSYLPFPLTNMRDINGWVESFKPCRFKSLSSLGIIVNNTHAKITQYHKEGKSANEIADLMNMNVNVVKAYLPRNRPQYKVNQSKNALAVQRSKERHKKH